MHRSEERCIVLLVSHVRQKGNGAGTLDSDGELTLVSSTGTGYSAGKDLGTLGNELAKTGYILIINAFNTINAEMANLLAGFLVHGSIVSLVIHFKSLLKLKFSA